MHNCRFLIPAVLICLALSVAGCTTTTAPAASAAPVPAAKLTASTLAPADLPPGYVLVESRPKESAEISSLAHQSGWQAGYIVKYINNSAPEGSQDMIIQTITVYPAGIMPEIIRLVEKTDRFYSDLTFMDLAVSGLGENSGGFTGTLKTQPIVITGTPSTLSTESLSANPEPVVSGQNMAEVYFAKGTVLSVVRMAGPHADGEEVLALARTAYMKIP